MTKSKSSRPSFRPLFPYCGFCIALQTCPSEHAKRASPFSLPLSIDSHSFSPPCTAMFSSRSLQDHLPRRSSCTPPFPLPSRGLYGGRDGGRSGDALSEEGSGPGPTSSPPRDEKIRGGGLTHPPPLRVPFQHNTPTYKQGDEVHQSSCCPPHLSTQFGSAFHPDKSGLLFVGFPSGSSLTGSSIKRFAGQTQEKKPNKCTKGQMMRGNGEECPFVWNGLCNLCQSGI